MGGGSTLNWLIVIFYGFDTIVHYEIAALSHYQNSPRHNCYLHRVSIKYPSFSKIDGFNYKCRIITFLFFYVFISSVPSSDFMMIDALLSGSLSFFSISPFSFVLSLSHYFLFLLFSHYHYIFVYPPTNPDLP